MNLIQRSSSLIFEKPTYGGNSMRIEKDLFTMNRERNEIKIKLKQCRKYKTIRQRHISFEMEGNKWFIIAFLILTFVSDCIVRKF